MYDPTDAKLLKLLLGASYLGFDPFAIADTLMRGKAPVTLQKLARFLKVPPQVVLTKLPAVAKELPLLLETTRPSFNESSWYVVKARQIFANKEILQHQPLHVRWRWEHV